MPLNANKLPRNNNRTPVDPLDPGTYPIRLVQVIDLGLQPQPDFKGEAKDPAYTIKVTYEFLDEFMKDEDGNDIEDKPRWLSEDFAIYSLDSDRAKSTKRYMALDPELEHEGDWSKLIGAPGMLQIVQNVSKKNKDIIYNNITGLSSMRAKEASKAPDLINPGKVFSLDDPDIEVFNSLPDWIQDKIKGNLEFEGSALEKLLEGSTETSEDSGRVVAKKSKKAVSEAPVESESSSEEEDW